MKSPQFTGTEVVKFGLMPAGMTLPVRNAGRTPGFITESRRGWVWSDDLPEQPNYEGLELFTLQFPLSADTVFELGTGQLPPPQPLTKPGREHFSLFYYGYIAYADIFQKQHRTGFCWRIFFRHGNAVYYGGAPYNYYT